jgi:hypothetical protein
LRESAHFLSLIVIRGDNRANLALRCSECGSDILSPTDASVAWLDVGRAAEANIHATIVCNLCLNETPNDGRTCADLRTYLRELLQEPGVA